MKYKYTTDDTGSDIDDAIEFESQWDDTRLGWVAQDAAAVDYSDHDGWVAQWPQEFTINNVDGKKLGVFNVELDFEPVFHATEKKEGTCSHQTK